MRRPVMQHEHVVGCIGGPVVSEVEGAYRALVCRACGVAVEVSYPTLPADALAPEALVQFITRQIHRLQPH